MFDFPKPVQLGHSIIAFSTLMVINLIVYLPEKNVAFEQGYTPANRYIVTSQR